MRLIAHFVACVLPLAVFYGVARFEPSPILGCLVGFILGGLDMKLLQYSLDD